MLPSGVRYTDERVGGGAAPAKGMLVVLQYVGREQGGAVFEDTRARGKPIVYIYGGRPFTAGLCAGARFACWAAGRWGARGAGRRALRARRPGAPKLLS